MEHYDNDQRFDAYLFGDQNNGYLRKLHPLAFENPIHKIEGVIDAYKQALTQATFWGPTFFAPLIHEAINKASSYTMDSSKYSVVMIMTDGEIMDYDETVDAIVKASTLPISIIIVGIGNNDPIYNERGKAVGRKFDAMVRLDGDKKALKNTNGVKSKRDIVDFVVANDIKIGDHIDFQLMAKKVLVEVPEQLESYMLYKNYKPQVKVIKGHQLQQIPILPLV